MKVDFAVKLLAVIPKEFTSEEGEEVSYNEHYFLNVREDGEKEVIKFNSKLNLADHEGGNIAITVDVDPTGRAKPKLIGVVGSE